MQLGKFGKIGIAWCTITVVGIYGFVLSKRSVDKKRLENMKIRDRMRKANQGEYEQSSRKFDY